MRKLTLTLIALSIIVLSSHAQVNGSVKLGLAGYQGDLHCRSDESIKLLDELNGSFGIGVHLPLSKVIGFRGEATYFRLSADETQFQEPRHAARGWTFTNNFIEIAGLLDWEILGKRRYKNGRFRRTLTPVIFGGIGLAFNRSEVDFKNVIDPNIEKDRPFDNSTSLAVPVGLGLKYYLSEKFALALEGGYRLPVSDYYDGVSQSGNPKENDTYAFGGIKAYFGLGGKNYSDRDGDGIVDKKDKCPDTFGNKTVGGCPDTDFDGVANSEDKCPTIFGAAKMGGCPDTDKDGITDDEDDCPTLAGTIATSGCPDSDGDGVIDPQDRCPNVAAMDSKSGCPDKDGDGVMDDADLCPEVAGDVFKQGCPFVDTDGDGVEDEMDECPKEFGTAASQGCPEKINHTPNDVIVPAPTTPEYATISKNPDVRMAIESVNSQCVCTGNANPIFNLPINKEGRVLTRLGTNPEFGNSHDLSTSQFYEKLKTAYSYSGQDKKFLDELFVGMGYAGFADATADLFSEAEIPFGANGNIGYSKAHKTIYATLNAKSAKDLMAFRIRSANGCDVHFMKTCGNHFFFCTK